jgi:hypothetical protein
MSHVGAEEAHMADTCRMGLVFKGILPKWRIIYINGVLGMQEFLCKNIRNYETKPQRHTRTPK